MMNTVPKINSLPPEVLALIPYFLDSSEDLVKTTHVCRHWRNIFIASPPLWSLLDNGTMHEELVTVYIDRCDAALLDVTFSSEDTEEEYETKNHLFVKKLAPRWANVRTLCFPGVPWRHIVELSNAIDARLPMLREVNIDVDVDYDDEVDDVPDPEFVRPFLAGATNLVSFTLLGFNWRTCTLLHFVFPTLTHLELQFDEIRVPSVHELMELFRNSPLVEDIYFTAADYVQEMPQSGGHSTIPDQFPPVDLPRLHRVRFDWFMLRSQLTLLSHINYPPTCSVSMKTESMFDVSQPPQNPFPNSWVVFSLPRLSSVTLRMWRNRHSTECTVIVKELDGPSISITHSQHFEGYFSNPKRDRDDGHVLSAAISLIGKFPLHWIREFVLEDFKGGEMSKPESFEIPPLLVKLIRSDLPNLTTLSLTNTCVSELFAILSPTPLPPHVNIVNPFEEGGVSESSPPCPALKVLEMRHPDWVPSRHCPEILALTKARKCEKVPFERVFLHSPAVPLSITKGMSLHVEHIEIQRLCCQDCAK